MRILIAEDDQVLADGLLRALRGAGAAVDHVASGSGICTLLAISCSTRVSKRRSASSIQWPRWAWRQLVCGGVSSMSNSKSN